MHKHLAPYLVALVAACGGPSSSCEEPARRPADMAPMAAPDLSEVPCVPCAQSLPDMGPPMGCVPSLCVETADGALCCVGTGHNN